jgi:hypothetical protein
MHNKFFRTLLTASIILHGIANPNLVAAMQEDEKGYIVRRPPQSPVGALSSDFRLEHLWQPFRDHGLLIENFDRGQSSYVALGAVSVITCVVGVGCSLKVCDMDVGKCAMDVCVGKAWAIVGGGALLEALCRCI